ncbi:hypothetical protein AMTR_s00105p00072830, partial [Amborella trichopoda]
GEPGEGSAGHGPQEERRTKEGRRMRVSPWVASHVAIELRRLTVEGQGRYTRHVNWGRERGWSLIDERKAWRGRKGFGAHGNEQMRKNGGYVLRVGRGRTTASKLKGRKREGRSLGDCQVAGGHQEGDGGRTKGQEH